MQDVPLPMVNTIGDDYTGKNKTKIKSDEIAIKASFSRKLTLNLTEIRVHRRRWRGGRGTRLPCTRI